MEIILLLIHVLFLTPIHYIQIHSIHEYFFQCCNVVAKVVIIHI